VRAQGLEIELGPVDRTGAEATLRSLYLRDPDGNLVELSEPGAAHETS
jgi:catechol 2,3-dioxygenase-like lactoylglutathione lyase family enzyme